MIRPYKTHQSLGRLTRLTSRLNQAENKDLEKQKILEEFSRANPPLDPLATPELAFQAKERVHRGGRPIQDPQRSWTKKQRMEYIKSKLSI